MAVGLWSLSSNARLSASSRSITSQSQCLLFRHYKPLRERYAFLVGLVLGTPHRQFDDPARCRVGDGARRGLGGRRQSRWLRTADGFAV
jgi:hypothetical protein